jgi:hypothetical protein
MFPKKSSIRCARAPSVRIERGDSVTSLPRTTHHPATMTTYFDTLSTVIIITISDLQCTSTRVDRLTYSISRSKMSLSNRASTLHSSWMPVKDSLRCLVSLFATGWSKSKCLPCELRSDLLGSAAFSVVQKDLNGNIDKIQVRSFQCCVPPDLTFTCEARLDADPGNSFTLEGMLAEEAKGTDKTGTQALLWLLRCPPHRLIAAKGA